MGAEDYICGKDIVHLCVEFSVRSSCIVWEKLPGARICLVKVQGDFKRVAYYLIGRARDVDYHRQGVEVGLVQVVLSARGSAKASSDLSNLSEFSPGSPVVQPRMQALEVEGISVSKRQKIVHYRSARAQGNGGNNLVLQGFGAYGRIGGPDAIS